MQYVSTRGDKKARAFTDISFTAFAPDGGLWMPDEVPQVTPEKLHTWLGTDYAGLAFEIFHLFAPEIPRRDLWTLCRDAYQPKEFSFRRNPFDAEAVTPVTWLRDGVELLELSNGPTLAFDDLSLRFASLYLQRVMPEEERPRILLGATSGDMGASAAHHFANIPGVDLVLVSPKDRMSQCQARILYNETAPNVHHLVGEGTFDDCQDLVNRVLADEAFCREHRIGAINSTLWLRIVSHLVYYFWSYLQAVDRVGEEVVYAVPAGIRRGYFKVKVLELLLFLSALDVAHEKHGYTAAQVRLARAARDALLASTEDDVTISALSQELGASPSQLAASFRGVYGMTPAAFLRAQKMHSAAQLLRTSDRTVLDIAGQFGYDNASKFAKAFRSVIGVSPSAYRAGADSDSCAPTAEKAE